MVVGGRLAQHAAWLASRECHYGDRDGRKVLARRRAKGRKLLITV